MKILNPLQMNDWNIKSFLTMIYTIQFAMWGSIGFDILGIPISILRVVIGFTYLVFVPGIIILRILKLHKLGNIETLFFTVSISISFMMFIGFFINMIYPILKIAKPLSTTPLIIAISAVVLVLTAVAYLRDREFSDPTYINNNDLFSVKVLFLIMIPFLSIYGTYFVNFYHINILLMLLIIIISLIVFLIGFDKIIPAKLYPLTISVISISLLFHTALISRYIWGWDMQVEYYVTNSVIRNSLWIPAYYSNTNSMLSLVMLGPIFSNILNMSLIWVYKVIYIILYSLVPLGLYQIYRKQTDAKIALFSCFFFMTFYGFHTEMPFLAKQQIAEIYVVAFLLAILEENMSELARSVLLLLFSFSLIVSHYGLSYIFMTSITIVYIFQYFSYHYTNKKLIPTLQASFVITLLVFLLTWYINIANSSTFVTIIHIGEQISNSITTDLMNKDSAQGLALITRNASSPLHSIGKNLQMIANLFITIGVSKLLLKNQDLKYDDFFSKNSIVFYSMLIAGIIVPFFSSQLNTSRLYQISLIFLAPFCIIGAIETFKISISLLPKRTQICRNINIPYKIISIFLILLLLFNSGFIFEITHDNPTSFSLSNIDYPIYTQQDIMGKEWLCNYSTINDQKRFIYADEYRWLLFLSSIQSDYIRRLPDNVNSITKESYIYLSTYNLLNNEVRFVNQTSVLVDPKYMNLNPYISMRNEIYSNGGSKIYIK